MLCLISQKKDFKEETNCILFAVQNIMDNETKLDGSGHPGLQVRSIPVNLKFLTMPP